MTSSRHCKKRNSLIKLWSYNADNFPKRVDDVGAGLRSFTALSVTECVSYAAFMIVKLGADWRAGFEIPPRGSSLRREADQKGRRVGRDWREMSCPAGSSGSEAYDGGEGKSYAALPGVTLPSKTARIRGMIGRRAACNSIRSQPCTIQGSGNQPAEANSARVGAKQQRKEAVLWRNPSHRPSLHSKRAKSL